MRKKLTGLLAVAALTAALGLLGGCGASVEGAASLPETGPAPASQEAEGGAPEQTAEDDALEQAAREEAEALAAAEAAEREAEEKAAAEAAAQKEAEEKAAAEAAAEAKAAEEAAAAEAAAQQEAQAQQQQEEKQAGSVYVAASGKGKKYHSNPNCSSMNGTKELSKTEAEKQGFTPCKKCY